MTSFSARLDALRRGFSEEATAAQTLPALKDLLATMSKQLDREKTAVYMFKELLNVYAELDDRDHKLRGVLLETLEYLLGACRGADDSIRMHFLVRTYNAMVKFNGRENNRYMILQCCELVTKCPMIGDQRDLLQRLCKVVLRAVWDLKADKASTKGALDFICTTSLQLVEHWSQSAEAEVRTKAIAIYHDVFGNATAVLYRLFNLDESRAVDFFRKLVHLFRSKGNFTESELRELLQQSLPYLENILSLGDASKPYLQFADFLDIFERINDAATKKHWVVLRDYLKFQNSSVPDEKRLADLSVMLRKLSGSSGSDPLLVDIVVFITMQLRIHLEQMKQQAVVIARPAIDLCKSLMKFSKYCPRSLAFICSRCASSSRHLIDYISTMVVQLAMMLSKAGQGIDAELVALVSGFLKHKLQTLDDLSCEKQQSLLDNALRFVVNWVRVCLQLVNSVEMLELTRMVIDFKYRYGFDFLTPIYLVRLLESCVKDSGSSWEIINVKLIKLLLTLRDDSAVQDTVQKNVDEVIYSVITHQIGGKDQKLRELDIPQLLERPELELFGFPISPTLNQQEEIAILLLEMNWASRYKNSFLLDYFERLQKLSTDPVQLGMTLYLFQDGNIAQVSDETKESLKVKLQNARPNAAIDKIRRHGALGLLSYYEFSATSKAIAARLKDCQFNRETLKNDQINDILRENTMEQEMVMLTQLEQTYLHYRDMTATLAETSFQHFGLIYSLKQISSMVYNTCRFYQISYYPRRSVEMQLLNYVLLSQKPDRVLDLCCPLGFLLENHQIYAKLLKEPFYQKSWVPSLDQLASKATETISSAESSMSKASETLKYNYMNLHLSLSLYEASKRNLPASIGHLRQLNVLLQRHPDSTTVSVIRGRIYHVLFRLVTVYGIPPPRGISVRIFVRLMLEHYNEIQKLSTDYAFVVPTSTLEMTIETLRYLIVRYDTDRIEAHVEQILRFVMRRGAGMRAMQVLTMYATLNADGEKTTKSRMLLTFLDRLLMFRPLVADCKDSSKGQFGDTLEVPQISLSETPNGVDPTRKAVKYVKSPQKRSPSPNLFPEQQIDWRQYLVHHHSGCSCQFCRWPQYKCAALLVLAGYARVAFLSGNDEQCHQLYSALSEFWAQRKNCFEADELLGQREDFLAMMARAFMNYGQLLMKNVVLESARREFRKSLEIVRSIGVGADPALVQDIEMNLQALEDVAKFVPNSKPSGAPSFAEFIKQNAHLEPAPAIRTNKFLLKTPKVGPSRVIPKTASRADDLLKQVARKRLKTVLAENNHSHETELISAMTGLSCGSERRPKTKVSIFVDSPEKPASGRLHTGKKKLFCKETYSAEQETSPKKPARERNLASETPAAAPKLTRKKRLPLSPTLHASSSTESFKDALVNGLQCSTPKVSTVATRAKGRTTSKKPKLNIEYPKLGRAKSKSPKQNHSFNSSFRDVLLKSITESAKQRPPTADSSVIVLDDSDDVVNASIVENTSINHSCGGVLSLKKYSDRKVYGSTRKKITAKTRLQFDSSVVDITTPVSSPVLAVAPTPASGSSSAETVQVVKRTRGRPKVVKTTEITPELGAAVPGKITRTTRKVRGKAGAV